MKLIITILLASVFAFGWSSAMAEEEAPLSVEGATTVDTASAKQLFDSGAVFVDPRKVAEYDAGRIPGAISLELKSQFNEDNLMQVAKKDAPIVFYCNGPLCPRSAECSKQAVAWGFKKVHYFRDGLPAWKSAGYPVE